LPSPCVTTTMDFLGVSFGTFW